MNRSRSLIRLLPLILILIGCGPSAPAPRSVPAPAVAPTPAPVVVSKPSSPFVLEDWWYPDAMPPVSVAKGEFGETDSMAAMMGKRYTFTAPDPIERVREHYMKRFGDSPFFVPVGSMGIRKSVYADPPKFAFRGSMSRKQDYSYFPHQTAERWAELEWQSPKYSVTVMLAQEKDETCTKVTLLIYERP